MGDHLHREQIIDNGTIDDESLQKAVLKKRGAFVAVTGPEGRFQRLIDRNALVEKVASY